MKIYHEMSRKTRFRLLQLLEEKVDSKYDNSNQNTTVLYVSIFEEKSLCYLVYVLP